MLLASLALLAAQTARAAEPQMFPLSDELFRRLLADPRQAQTRLSYYREYGLNLADAALGNTWGLLRWQDLGGSGWDAQWNVEGMAYSRFKLSGGVNEFEAVDFFANVPVEFRRGRLSARASLFHESSHLGDDHIRRTGNAGYRYSIEGLRLVASIDAAEGLRLFGGGSALLHSVPRAQKGSLEAGFELRSRDLGWFAEHPCWLYAAQDFTAQGRRGWNIDSNTEAGLRLGFPHVVRALRAHIGYYDGHSQFGQFYNNREQYASLGLSFDF